MHAQVEVVWSCHMPAQGPWRCQKFMHSCSGGMLLFRGHTASSAGWCLTCQLLLLQELLGCQGAGLMCVFAAAHPERYLQKHPVRLYVPSEVMEVDLRGRMQVVKNGKYAYIDIGEINSVVDPAKAVEQLGLRLGVLRWLVCACGGVAEADIGLVGRLFVPKHTLGSTFVEEQQGDKALREWGFSLYVHAF